MMMPRTRCPGPRRGRRETWLAAGAAASCPSGCGGAADEPHGAGCSMADGSVPAGIGRLTVFVRLLVFPLGKRQCGRIGHSTDEPGATR